MIRLGLLHGALCGAVVASAAVAAPAPVLRWALVDSRPHDPGAFTEGLVAHQGRLLESTGDCCSAQRGDSSVRTLDASSGRVLAIRWLPAPLFAEGLTVLRGTAWQLTWQDDVAFEVDPATLAQRRAVRYPRDGWGLTTDGGRLVASDGSARLYSLTTPDLRTVRQVTVTDDGRPVTQLNELEMINGVIWANVWQSDRIALIDPRTGVVRGWLDMSSLRRRLGRPGEVLNGIARDPVTGHVVVTGKFWDRMFVIRLSARLPEVQSGRSRSRAE